MNNGEPVNRPVGSGAQLHESVLNAQRVLADALPTLVMMSGRDGVVSFFNRRWYEFTGQPFIERDASWDWRKYMHPDDGARVAKMWKESVALGHDVIEMEYRLREAATGDYRWFHARAVAIRETGGPIVQWLGTATDIHDQRFERDELVRLYKQELSITQRFQEASLPPSMPKVAGIRFDGFYSPSSQDVMVGGDWYDAFALSDGSIVLSVGDVLGHGLDSAVIMGKIRHSIRTLAISAHAGITLGLPRLFENVEETLASEYPGSSATAFLGVLTPGHDGLQYASAGHPPPLLRERSGITFWLKAFGAPLGWSFGMARTQSSADLSRASDLVLYTDGLIEAGRMKSDGMERLQRIVEIGDVFTSESPAEAIVTHGVAAPPHDDVAVLTVSFRPGPA